MFYILSKQLRMTHSEIQSQRERFDYLMETEWDLYTIGKKFTEKSKTSSASAYVYIHELLNAEEITPSMTHQSKKNHYSAILVKESLKAFNG